MNEWKNQRVGCGISGVMSRAGLLAVLLGLSIPRPAAASGNWLKLANSAPDSVGMTLLLSDGTVIAANNPTSTSDAIGNDWYKLTPDPNGHYVNGEWTRIASAHDSRRFNSSQMLTNGLVFVAGGEYGTGMATAELYDPIANQWTRINPPTSLLDPSAGKGFLDSESDVLPNGTVLIRPTIPNSGIGTLIYDPRLNNWSAGSNTILRLAEESWVKLPDGSILTIDPIITDSNGVSGNGFGTNSERYVPSLGQWIADATVPVAIYTPLAGFVGETGPAFLLPNGKAFFLGGTGHTAIYTPSGSTNKGTWAAGPDIPGGLVSADAPAAMMPNGKILCAVAGGPSIMEGNDDPTFPAPTSFFEYDYTAGPVGSFTQVSGPTGMTDDISSYQSSMLLLPDGSVLYNHFEENNLFYSSFGSQLYVYVPDTGQGSAVRPVITSLAPNADGSFHLVGIGLNGISEGAAYGDDIQMSCNYPIVTFTDTNNGHVDYARTYNWSSSGVMTGSKIVTTEFTLPAGLTPQTYLVGVSAVGVTSAPVTFSFVTPSSLALCPGDSGTLSVITSPQPATYQWLFNENPLAGQTNATLNLTSVTTNQSGYYSLKITSGGGSTVSPPVPVSVGVWVSVPPAPTNSATLCQTESLALYAYGKGTLSAQWYRNNELVVADSHVTNNTLLVASGETYFSLNFWDVRYQDDGTYTVTITDDCGPVTTAPFTMRVVPNPPWVQVATNGPVSRQYAAMCFDSGRNVAVLFGGQVANPTGSPVVGDTWEFDGTNWTQHFPATFPVARSQAQMVYDSNRHRSVLFGGQIFTNGQFHLSLETWEWNGTNWQRITTPTTPGWTQPDFFSACFDSARREMLIFGGQVSTGRVNQLWGYNGTNWSQKTPAAPTPVAPSSLMAFDSLRGVAVLLGGNSQMYFSPYSQAAVWEWDGTAWHERQQSGQTFGGASVQDMLVFDTFRKESVLYGSVFGIVDGVSSSSGPGFIGYRFIWRWNGQEWQADPPTPTTGVVDSIYASMCFDTSRNAIVLFGGEDAGGTGPLATNYTFEILYQDDPAILKQPLLQTALLGQNVQLSAVAVGAPIIGYQWQKEGVNLTDNGHITGSGTNALTINAVTGADSGHYQLVLSNLCGMFVSRPIQFTVTTSGLTIAHASSNQLVITWSDTLASLQSAPSLSGPWTTLSGIHSPYQFIPSASATYFRLIH